MVLSDDESGGGWVWSALEERGLNAEALLLCSSVLTALGMETGMRRDDSYGGEIWGFGEMIFPRTPASCRLMTGALFLLVDEAVHRRQNLHPA